MDNVSDNFSFPNNLKVDKELIILATVALLLIPALLINIGELPPFSYSTGISKESSQIFRVVHEFLTHIPSLLLAIGFSLMIFIFLRPILGDTKSILVSLMFITSGRVFFWETINYDTDFGFALLVFITFITIFHCYKTQKYLRMFILSWSITAIAFVMKGFPALAFQVITISTFLILERRIKLLISNKHLIGLLMFAGIVFLYAGLNSDSISFPMFWRSLLNLFIIPTVNETQKTGFLVHVVQFPTEIFLYFLPWTVLIVSCFRKDFFTIIQQNAFLKFSMIAFFANILVYWLFPGLSPQYTLALFPFLLIVLLHFFNLDMNQNGIRYRTIYGILIGMSIAVLAFFVVAPFLNILAAPVYGDIKLYLLFQVSLLIVLFIIKLRKHTLIFFLALVSIVRIAFDWFVLPIQLENYSEYKYNNHPIETITEDKSIIFLPKNAPFFSLSSFESCDENR
jgi:4-amino-4-deoxy-L-arabinose transferase-like glycosyltransferase